MKKFIFGTIFGAFAWTGIATILVRYVLPKEDSMANLDELTNFRD